MPARSPDPRRRPVRAGRLLARLLLGLGMLAPMASAGAVPAVRPQASATDPGADALMDLVGSLHPPQPHRRLVHAARPKIFVRPEIAARPKIVAGSRAPASVLAADVPKPGTPAPSPPAVDGILPGLPATLVAVVEGGVAPSKPAGAAALQPAGISASEKPGAPIEERPGGNAGTRPPAAESKPSAPVSLTAQFLNDPDPAKSGLLLPFESGVGAAAFSRGPDVIIVFDAARPLDLSSVQQQPFAARAAIHLLPEATVLRLRGTRPQDIRVRRVPAGWLVRQTAPDEPPGVAIRPEALETDLKLPVRSPGHVVIVPDEQTGGNLLVGSVVDGSDYAQNTWRGGMATIDRTILGVVVEPLSDRLELRTSRSAFLLSGFPEGVVRAAGSAGIFEDPAGLGSDRVMLLEPGSQSVLGGRFLAALSEAAASPPGERFLPRLREAEDALAIGDAREAEAIIKVAMIDDPRKATLLRARLVQAASALLLHRHAAFDVLDDAGPSQGEVGLWRGVRLAQENPASPEAARLFAENAGLLKAYPEPLRRMLLSDVGLSLARAGTDAQAAVIDGLPDAPELGFARAVLDERRGRTDRALPILDRLASSSNLSLASRAVEEAVTLREQRPGADPKALADVLESRLYDARLSGHEVPSMLHLAHLRTLAGQWQKALDLYREAIRLDPADAADIRRRAGETLSQMISAARPVDGKTMLGQAALLETNADLAPSGAGSRQVATSLVARLSDLDLPDRAAGIVQRMITEAGAGGDKAGLGLQLARLRLQQNDLAGVQAALAQSDPGNLSAADIAARQIVLARALAGHDQLDPALAALGSCGSAEALELRADILTRKADWPGASDTLLSLARLRLPSAGKLGPEDQELLLRLASAASRTGDRTRINEVRTLGNGRVADAGRRAMFELLTAPPKAAELAQAPSPAQLALLH